MRAPPIDPKIQTAGVITVGVLALGLIAYFVYRVAKPIGDALGGLGDTTANVTEILSNTTADVRDVAADTTGSVANTFGAVAGFFDKPGEVKGDTPYKDGLPTLKLRVASHKGGTGFAKKWNDVVVEVTDPHGQAVPGANVVFTPLHSVTRRINKVRYVTTGPDGRASFHWQVGGIAGTHAEDDMSVIANRDGYNSSNRVTVK